MPKTFVAAGRLCRIATSRRPVLQPVPLSIRTERTYRLAADADIIICCVDNAEVREVLNHLAYANCLPVINGEVLVAQKNLDRRAMIIRTSLRRNRVAQAPQTLRGQLRVFAHATGTRRRRKTPLSVHRGTTIQLDYSNKVSLPAPPDEVQLREIHTFNEYHKM